jgi:hypothetical protein
MVYFFSWQLKMFEEMGFKVDHASPVYKRFRLKVLGKIFPLYAFVKLYLPFRFFLSGTSNLFFLISKICFIKKLKMPLSIQGIYTGTTKTTHKKKPEQTHWT